MQTVIRGRLPFPGSGLEAGGVQKEVRVLEKLEEEKMVGGILSMHFSAGYPDLVKVTQERSYFRDMTTSNRDTHTDRVLKAVFWFLF